MAKRMVAMGDSIYAGVSGSGGSVTGDKRIPNMIANELGWSCDNEAVSGSTLAGKGGGDFLQMVQRLNFKNYDVCLLEYGVNDFDWTWEGLSELPPALDKGVEKIRGDNPDIMIFYQLPTPTWKHVDSLDKEDGNGWTQNDMARVLSQECSALGIPYYAWTDPIITYANTKETQGDTIHPNPATMKLIADRLANWLRSAASGLVGTYTSNITSIYARVQKLQQNLNTVFAIDGDKLDLTINAPPESLQNRAVYLWTIDSIKHLQEVMNALIALYNQYGIIDIDTGEETENVHLWLPQRLIIDAVYTSKLNENFEKCNKLLDQLEKNMKTQM